MTRKPTAVSLSSAETKKRESKGQTREKQASENSAPESKVKQRKPRAMPAPDASKADPFPAEEIVAPSHAAERMIVSGGKRSRWPGIFLASAGSLIILGMGLWFTQIIEELFSRHLWLGWIGAALAVLTGIALFAIILKEIGGLWRLRKLASLREESALQLEGDATPDPKTIDRIVALYEDRKEMYWHLSRLASHADDVMDVNDRLLLAERYLLKPLDKEAKRLITATAQRVSVMTAINPAPALDVIFVAWQILRLLRQITALYGSRAGSFGTLRLARMVGSHLAITGGLALSDTLIQQFIGKGLAGRLSAKLGEGTINGILTARIGIAAMDLCRPMPFAGETKPGLKEFISLLVGSMNGSKDQDAAS